MRKSAYAHVRRRSARTTKAIQMCLTHPFSNCGTPGVRTSAILAGGGGIRAMFGKGGGVCLSVPKNGTGTLQRTVLQPAGDRSAPEIARTTLPAPTLHETAPLPAGIGLGMTEARRHGRDGPNEKRTLQRTVVKSAGGIVQPPGRQGQPPSPRPPWKRASTGNKRPWNDGGWGGTGGGGPKTDGAPQRVRIAIIAGNGINRAQC